MRYEERTLGKAVLSFVEHKILTAPVLGLICGLVTFWAVSVNL